MKEYNIKYKVDHNQFINVEAPEVAYILGLLWADGHVHFLGTGKRNIVNIECVEEDLKECEWIFDKVGKWFKNYRVRKNRKPQMMIGTSNLRLALYLSQNDYTAKSERSACKILSTIPENLQHYWFRGLSDGDGCFYVNDKSKYGQFVLASSYNQDWAYMEKLCNKLNIKYNINQQTQLQNNHLNKHSALRITGVSNIKKLGNYIYKNRENDDIGLDRKYNKFLIIKNNFTQFSNI
jgi:hypothetical protein